MERDGSCRLGLFVWLTLMMAQKKEDASETMTQQAMATGSRGERREGRVAVEAVEMAEPMGRVRATVRVLTVLEAMRDGEMGLALAVALAGRGWGRAEGGGMEAELVLRRL